jgi:FkbM family methyltransferase
VGLRVTPLGTGILSRSKSILSEKNRYKWLQDMNIRTVIDVGANIGQSALEFHKIFPDAKIYSFEPLHDCFMQMNANLKKVPNFRSFNLALGDKKEKRNIHHSEYSPSSSLRKMAKLHKEVYPKSAGDTLETIDVDTFDNVAQGLDLEENIFLKIDTQGYEDRVINGARNTLSRIKVVIIETSFRELYEGQPLFSDIYELLHKQGFVYLGSWSGDALNRLDGAHLTQDSIFIVN